MVKIVVILLSCLIALLLLVVVIGYALPRGHRASCGALFPIPPESLWEIVNHRSDTGWRTDLKFLELLSADGSHWRETNSEGDVITFRIEDSIPHQRLVTRIADENLPFGGSWTYEFVSEGRGTHLTITEDGEVYNPIFRFVSRFFMDPSATLRTYLEDLGRRVESDPRIDCPTHPRS